MLWRDGCDCLWINSRLTRCSLVVGILRIVEPALRDELIGMLEICFGVICREVGHRHRSTFRYEDVGHHFTARSHTSLESRWHRRKESQRLGQDSDEVRSIVDVCESDVAVFLPSASHFLFEFRELVGVLEEAVRCSREQSGSSFRARDQDQVRV